MRKKIVAGNWKMHKNPVEAYHFSAGLKEFIGQNQLLFDVHIYPNFLAIPIVAHEWAGLERLKVGAQNCHQASAGAYTGETSPSMIKAAGASTVLVGHSERREYNNEDHPLLLTKIKNALSEGLQPIYCCGESLEDRNAGTHFSFVEKQLEEVLYALSPTEISQLVIAYEPIWAIGTGLSASPAQAQEMHQHIRKCLANKFGAITAESMSILYGGSLKPATAMELFSQTDIDGGLIGGASLSIEDFSQIMNSMQQILSS